MKRSFLILIIFFSGVLVYSQVAQEKLMPVTTDSKSALSLYSKARRYYDDVKINKAIDTFEKALDQDPDFFMANYQLAFYYLMNADEKKFNVYANAAINCKYKLSDAEEILKIAIQSIRQGNTDIRKDGKKLVEMYPEDPESYSNLIYFQSLANDSSAMVETLEKVIKIATSPAPFYNQLGYAYLTMKQNDKAEAAFNKYIELDPDNPNVYDSKGDYFMFIKKYDMAYELYMKAHDMDSSFSSQKAEMAKRLYEQTEGKELQIISI